MAPRDIHSQYGAKRELIRLLTASLFLSLSVAAFVEVMAHSQLYNIIPAQTAYIIESSNINNNSGAGDKGQVGKEKQ